jgi:hypothetical protein
MSKLRGSKYYAWLADCVGDKNFNPVVFSLCLTMIEVSFKLFPQQ